MKLYQITIRHIEEKQRMYAAESVDRALQMANESLWIRRGKYRVIKIEEVDDVTVQEAWEPEELHLIITALKCTASFSDENNWGKQTQELRDLYTKLEATNV